MKVFQYDSQDFPIYSLDITPGFVLSQENTYQCDSMNSEERVVLPHYHSSGVLDTVTYLGKNSEIEYYTTLHQETYNNGDSIVVKRNFFNAANEFQQVDFFLRTVSHDTVQIRYYRDRIDPFQEYTRNKVNGLIVESYFEKRNSNITTTTYNSLGLPVKTFATGVSNEGSGNVVIYYEYYVISSKKKVRLLK